MARRMACPAASEVRWVRPQMSVVLGEHPAAFAELVEGTGGTGGVAVMERLPGPRSRPPPTAQQAPGRPGAGGEQEPAFRRVHLDAGPGKVRQQHQPGAVVQAPLGTQARGRERLRRCRRSPHPGAGRGLPGGAEGGSGSRPAGPPGRPVQAAPIQPGAQEGRLRLGSGMAAMASGIGEARKPANSPRRPWVTARPRSPGNHRSTGTGSRRRTPRP